MWRVVGGGIMGDERWVGNLCKIMPVRLDCIMYTRRVKQLRG